MAKNVSLLQLRTDALARGDFAGFVDRYGTTEVNRYLNQSIGAFQDFLIGAWGSKPFEQDYIITTSKGQTSYAIAAQFYQLLRVEMNSGASVYDLLPAGRGERATLRDTNNYNSGYPRFYSLRGSNLELLPTPLGTYTVTLEYVPAYTTLSNDGDSLDGVNGWDEWVSVDSARKMAIKDADWQLVSALRDDLALIESRIRAMAPARDRGERRVIDVLSRRRVGR